MLRLAMNESNGPPPMGEGVGAARSHLGTQEFREVIMNRVWQGSHGKVSLLERSGSRVYEARSVLEGVNFDLYGGLEQ